MSKNKANFPTFPVDVLIQYLSVQHRSTWKVLRKPLKLSRTVYIHLTALCVSERLGKKSIEDESYVLSRDFFFPFSLQIFLRYHDRCDKHSYEQICPLDTKKRKKWKVVFLPALNFLFQGTTHHIYNSYLHNRLIAFILSLRLSYLGYNNCKHCYVKQDFNLCTIEQVSKLNHLIRALEMTDIETYNENKELRIAIDYLQLT